MAVGPSTLTLPAASVPILKSVSAGKFCPFKSRAVPPALGPSEYLRAPQ